VFTPPKLLEWSANVCYMCAKTAGPSGLPLYFWGTPQGVYACWVVPDWATGHQGTLHQALVASLVDDAMGHAIYHRAHIATMTAELTVQPCHSIARGIPITVQGWVNRHRSRLFLAQAQIVAANGDILIKASGKFVPAPASQQPSAD